MLRSNKLSFFFKSTPAQYCEIQALSEILWERYGYNLFLEELRKKDKCPEKIVLQRDLIKKLDEQIGRNGLARFSEYQSQKNKP